MKNWNENKYKAIRLQERAFVVNMLRMTLSNLRSKDYENEIKVLHDYCCTVAKEHNHGRTFLKYLDNKFYELLQVFTDTPDAKKLNTVHLGMLSVFLWNILQQKFDVGQDNEEVKEIVIFMENQYEKFLNEGDEPKEKFLKSLLKKADKVVAYLNSKELYLHSDSDIEFTEVVT